MTDKQLRIYRVFEDLPLPAKISKCSVAGDVSKLLGEEVTYEELTEAIHAYNEDARECVCCVYWLSKACRDRGHCTLTSLTTNRASTCGQWKKFGRN